MLRTNLVVAAVVLAVSGLGWAADIDTKGSVPTIAAEGDLVAMVMGDGTSLTCAISQDGGQTFGEAREIGKVSPGQMLGMRRGPQIAVRGKAIVIATNNEKGNRIVSFRSTDAGKTWEGPTMIDAPAGRSPEGLMSIATTRDGFAVVFLELIDKSMRIAVTRTTDDGATWKESQLVYASPDGHVCECCQPTIVADRAGNVAVMFRNWLGGNRDMYVTMSKDDGKTFGEARKLGEGSWKLKACPMDGGGIAYVSAPKAAGQLMAVFRRMGTLYTVRPGEREAELTTGKSAVIAPTSEGPVIAWETKDGVTVRGPKGSDVSIEAAAAPVLAVTSRGVLLAYTTRAAGATKTHTRMAWQAKSR